MKVLKEFCS